VTRLRAAIPAAPSEPEAIAEHGLSAARQSGAVAELGSGDRA
jgi:hypothetical protein